jgi:hypothetical protein
VSRRYSGTDVFFVIDYILFTLQLYKHQLGIATAITIIHTTTAEIQASTGECGTK